LEKIINRKLGEWKEKEKQWLGYASIGRVNTKEPFLLWATDQDVFMGKIFFTHLHKPCGRVEKDRRGRDRLPATLYL
jgi:hypothetical protein